MCHSSPGTAEFSRLARLLLGRSSAAALGFLLTLAPLALATPPPDSTVTIVDHGFLPAVFPRYLGPEHGWQDVHNEDVQGRLWMRRELAFQGARIPWQIFQMCADTESIPVGRIGLRFPLSDQRTTKTQPRWAGTWGRHDEQFPGLLDVEIDSRDLADVPCQLTGTDDCDVGDIHASWEHPSAAVTATFLMLPDDDRLFVELCVRPRQQTESIVVVLRCWPRGDFHARTRSGTSPALGYNQPHSFPPDAATVLFTDPKADPKGNAFEGTCAVTYMPQECVSAGATRTFPLFVRLELQSPPANEAVYCHVVLWELMQRRGDEAWDYLTNREDDTLSQFTRIRHFTAPAVVEIRERGVARVRDGLAELDRRLGYAAGPAGTPQHTAGYWHMTPRQLAQRWIEFHRAGVERALSQGDWQAAEISLKQATKHLD